MLGGYFFATPRRSINAAINTPIGVVILQSILECQCNEWKLGVETLPICLQKLVTTATSLEWPENKGHIDHLLPTNSENLVKVSLVHSEIIWPQGEGVLK